MSQHEAPDELDVRPLRKPDKHPAVFDRYRSLATGASFVLVNDHEPRHLRDEFENDFPGSYAWEILSSEPRNWRIKITKHTSTALPRVLLNTTAVATDVHVPDATGAVWSSRVRDRDLDANLVALPSDGTIDPHQGPDLDVLVHVLAGGGRLDTEQGSAQLRPGDLVLLPSRSRRGFAAGPDGLRYLTVHQRRESLRLDPKQRRAL